jgi:hypothetical protein
MKGYVGEACPEFGNFTMVRNGTCLKCDTWAARRGVHELTELRGQTTHSGGWQCQPLKSTLEQKGADYPRCEARIDWLSLAGWG